MDRNNDIFKKILRNQISSTVGFKQSNLQTIVLKKKKNRYN